MDTALATDSTPVVQPTWRRVTHLADLVAIFAPAVQVCVWQRDINAAVSAYLAGLERTGTLQTIETLSAEGRPQLARLPGGPGRDGLIDDLSLLREIICELLGCPAVGLRLARVGHAMCPGWHIDRVGIRLICTYQGPGTEWLDDQGIDRCELSLTQMADGAFIQAAPSEVVLLKGALWQGNERLGAVHRSPEIAAGASTRTLVTLDPLWHA
jgi:hypothetical protein